MYSCVGPPPSLRQVCILGITLGQLIQVGSSFGRISQSCLSDLSLFVLFHFSTFLLKRAQGDWMKTGLEKLSGVLGIFWEYQNHIGISGISERHRPQRHRPIGRNIIGCSRWSFSGLMMISKMMIWVQYALVK